MPLYEYRCQSCERVFEKFQSASEDPVTSCEFCSGPVKRVIHPAGIIFKGSGFYVTDSRKEQKSEGSSDTGSTE